MNKILRIRLLGSPRIIQGPDFFSYEDGLEPIRKVVVSPLSRSSENASSQNFSDKHLDKTQKETIHRFTGLSGSEVRKSRQPEEDNSTTGVQQTIDVTGQPLALFVFLVVTKEEQSRDVLANLFWHNVSTRQARKYLRNVLYDLRQEMDPYLTISRQTISLNPDAPLWLDVQDFVTQTQAFDQHSGNVQTISDKITRLEEAIALYREYLRGRYIQSLNALIDCYLANKNYNHGLVVSERLLALEPWQETVYRQRMELYVRMGDTPAALDQFITCRKELDKEFGIEPNADTVALYEQIKSGTYDSRIDRTKGSFLHRAKQREVMALLDEESKPNTFHVLSTDSTSDPKAQRANIYSSTDPLVEQSLNARPTTLEHPIPIPNNLTYPLNSLIGRQEEVKYGVSTLFDPACRLLTIYGLGGSGKTKLAHHIGRWFAQLEPQKQSERLLFTDGVYVIDLVGIELKNETDIASAILSLVATIGDAIGISWQNNLNQKEQLINSVRDQQMLLILDNFEHLLPLAGFIVDLLVQTAHLKLLITSRRRLEIQGEWLIPLEGLDFPDQLADDWETYPGCLLFLQRARQLNPGFESSEFNGATITR
ncbi:AAA family ATPase [Chloroflexi bacterium TSY]|nr:AAA family ATPase [Chloroflexi bacterium TSY]